MSTAPAYEPLPRGRSALPPEVVEASQRRRLLDAVTELTAEKGLARLTVSDLTAHAGVSRKSFYALFTDKTDCYIAGLTASSRLLLHAVRSAIGAANDPLDGVLEGFRAYLRALSVNPVETRAYLLEGMRAGPEAMAHRERVHQQFVELNGSALRRVRGRASENAIVALVGGINELVCRELDRYGERADVAGLEPDVIDLVAAVLHLGDATTERTT